jgi:hypothetical protein
MYVIHYPDFIAKDIDFHSLSSSFDDWSDCAESLFGSDKLGIMIEFDHIGFSKQSFKGMAEKIAVTHDWLRNSRKH